MIHWRALKQWLAALAWGAFATAASAQSPVAVVSFAATPDPATVGSPVAVDVTVSGVFELYAFQFSLIFDPAVLQVTSVAEGALLPSGGTTIFPSPIIDNTLGFVTVFDTLSGSAPGVGGSGVLANIGFSVTQPGISPLILTDVLLLDSFQLDLPVDVQGGPPLIALPAVPEPATWLLFGLGLAGVAGLARRRVSPLDAA